MCGFIFSSNLRYYFSPHFTTLFLIQVGDSALYSSWLWKWVWDLKVTGLTVLRAGRLLSLPSTSMTEVL